MPKAKRLTDTAKWSKPFFSGLEQKYKLLWMYVLDSCDHCGIWDCNLGLAGYLTGSEFVLKEVLEVFGERFQEIKSEPDKFFIPSFVSFQYGKYLNPKIPCHRSVMQALNELDIDWLTVEDKQSSEERAAPVQKAPAKTAKTGPPFFGVEIPGALNTDEFRACYGEFWEYRKQSKKPLVGRTVRSHMRALEPFGAEWAAARLAEAMERGWTGLVYPEDREKLKAGTLPNLTVAVNWSERLDEKLQEWMLDDPSHRELIVQVMRDSGLDQNVIERALPAVWTEALSRQALVSRIEGCGV